MSLSNSHDIRIVEFMDLFRPSLVRELEGANETIRTAMLSIIPKSELPILWDVAMKNGYTGAAASIEVFAMESDHASSPSEFERYPKYYEIICDVGVIGVCSQMRESDDNLLHCAQEDDVLAFGQLTEKQFDDFNDDKHWEEPISKRRYRPTVRKVLELNEIIEHDA